MNVTDIKALINANRAKVADMVSAYGKSRLEAQYGADTVAYFSVLFGNPTAAEIEAVKADIKHGLLEELN